MGDRSISSVAPLTDSVYVMVSFLCAPQVLPHGAAWVVVCFDLAIFQSLNEMCPTSSSI